MYRCLWHNIMFYQIIIHQLRGNCIFKMMLIRFLPTIFETGNLLAFFKVESGSIIPLESARSGSTVHSLCDSEPWRWGSDNRYSLYEINWGAWQSCAASEWIKSGTKQVLLLSAWQKWYATTWEANSRTYNTLWSICAFLIKIQN